ncbi:hypothetical protein Psch_02614 [Pelotomaculum schinkii]|uniref:Uncharacterized protein n=1 Tax=Pelotomaculum schinkii TaxID=78350 RepID=A0A4Y7RA80_9FIRM|nr:hypothetical protein Psch_02614 [Pelotomaculum schinkii]
MCLKVFKCIVDLFCRFCTGNLTFRIEFTFSIQLSNAIKERALNSTIITNCQLIVIGDLNRNKIDHWQIAMVFYRLNKMISKLFTCPFLIRV